MYSATGHASAMQAFSFSGVTQNRVFADHLPHLQVRCEACNTRKLFNPNRSEIPRGEPNLKSRSSIAQLSAHRITTTPASVNDFSSGWSVSSESQKYAVGYLAAPAAKKVCCDDKHRLPDSRPGSSRAQVDRASVRLIIAIRNAPVRAIVPERIKLFSAEGEITHFLKSAISSTIRNDFSTSAFDNRRNSEPSKQWIPQMVSGFISRRA